MRERSIVVRGPSDQGESLAICAVCKWPASLFQTTSGMSPSETVRPRRRLSWRTPSASGVPKASRRTTLFSVRLRASDYIATIELFDENTNTARLDSGEEKTDTVSSRKQPRPGARTRRIDQRPRASQYAAKLAHCVKASFSPLLFAKQRGTRGQHSGGRLRRRAPKSTRETITTGSRFT